jgi:Maltose acetyltransferase
MDKVSEADNEARRLKGELYYAFTPSLVAKRNRCHHACHRFNQAAEAPRRELVRLWREYVYPLKSTRHPRPQLTSN